MINPQQFRLLLAGPRVSRLRPFVVARGYLCDAATDGQTALDHLRATPRHVLLVELELGDMMLADLLAVVNEENLAGAVVLLDDPARSGWIVSTLTRGIDGYVATPPDESFLFRVIERQLLAQWAMAQAGELQVDTAARTKLEKQLNVERAKVTQLIKDLAGLRDELAQAQVQAASARAAAAEAAQASTAAAARVAPRSPAGLRGAAPRSPDASTVTSAAGKPAAKAPAEERSPFAGIDAVVATDQPTSPRGYDRGELAALFDDNSGSHQPTTAPGRQPASAVVEASAEIGFDESTGGTLVGADLRSPAPARPGFDDKSESDLFLDLDAEPGDEDEEPTTAGLPPTAPAGHRPGPRPTNKPLTDPFAGSRDE